MLPIIPQKGDVLKEAGFVIICYLVIDYKHQFQNLS